MMEKAAAIPADLLLLNLEDGVAVTRKEEARSNVALALKTLDFGRRELVVRINALGSETGMLDMAAVIPSRPDGICLPKMESVDQIRAADAAILELEARHGLPSGSVRPHAMIESAAGVLCARELAASSPRMASLIFGSADYVQDVRCLPGEDRCELMLALQMIVAGARAAAIDAIDAPCFDLKNPDLLRREAVQARRLGFDGKSALHPAQIDTLNGVFDVTPEEKAWAESVIAALTDAETRGRALTTLEGHLIDNPHRGTAERILRRAELSRRHG